MVKALVTVHYKEGILDPQGKAVNNALKSLGITGVSEARVGRHIVLNFPDLSRSDAKAQTEKACEKILTNPVIEDYEFETVEEEA
ncbi:MAG: phosphoribosylformylglycinamidine synthase subunit PurS [Candidatus Marinimicrobia bacterium]|nr:phosphoribosylformylglycinamidine synthase subunit PurS [Candidatus Neomarinimicrobiota bacterium]